MNSPNLHCVTLGDMVLRWYVSGRRLPTAYPSREDTLELFTRIPVWSTTRESDWYPSALTALSSLGIRPSSLNTCDDMFALIELVDRGNGVGLLVESLVNDRLADGRLVPLPFIRPMHVQFTIACRTNASMLIHNILESAVVCEARSRSRSRRQPCA